MSLASQSVAGSILIDAACLSTVRQQVRADDFEVAADRAIFEAACRLADAGQAADVVTIVQNARKHGADISDEYAATLMKVTPTAANATNYAATVHAEAVRRRLSEIGVRLMDACEDRTNTPAGIITEAMSALETDPKLAKRLGQIIRLAGGTMECFEYMYSGKCDVVLTDSTALYYYNCH